MIRTLILITAFLLFIFNSIAQPVYLATGGTCSFFSTTPVEDIDAHSTSMSAVLNTQTKELLFKVPMSTFKFKKALMQEHFNEKYVESDQFPYGIFKGKINEEVDFTKDGTTEVTATGTMNIHGIEQPMTEKGLLIIKAGKITISTDFKIKLKDYRIQIPKIVVSNIAEVVDVKMICEFSPYKKK